MRIPAFIASVAIGTALSSSERTSATLPPLVDSARQQSQAPQFTSRIDLVRTEVVVVDRKSGQPVTGLSARDFTVRENGVPRPISTFVSEEGEALGGAPIMGAAAAASSGRTFLFILGSGIREGTSDPYGGLARFIRQRLRPTDRAAMMVWDRVTRFTTDFEALASLAERRKRIPTDVVTLPQTAGGVRTGFSPKARAVLDRWLLGSEPADFLRPVAPLVLGVPELGADPYISQRLDAHIVSSDLLKVAGGIELLRHEPGEKHLVLVSLLGLAPPIQLKHFIMLRTSEEGRSLGERAADAGVALDLITTYGTMDPPSLDWSLALLGAQEIADESGGEFTSLRTVEQQLGRVDNTSRHGYIIGFPPGNAAEDGQRRRVSISVNRSDVTLVYRRGYTARSELPPLDVRGYVTRTRMTDAATAAIDLDDIRLRATSTFVTGRSATPEVRVELTIDPSRFSWPAPDGTPERTLDLTILCGDKQRKTIGSGTHRLTMGRAEEKFVFFVPVKGRPINAKVIVYSYDDDRVGSLSLNVR